MPNDFSMGTVKRDPAPKPPAYVHQAFPSYRFHPSGKEQLVKNQAEADALMAKGWDDKPFPPPPEGAVAPVVESAPAAPCRKCAKMRADFDKSWLESQETIRRKNLALIASKEAADTLRGENAALTAENASLKALIEQLGGRPAEPQPAVEPVAEPAPSEPVDGSTVVSG